MPLVFDHAQQPPDGYDFPDPSGVRLSASSLRELPKRVADFRANNGLPAGNPAAEVERDYAVRFPWLVTKVGVTPTVIEDPVARWINGQWRNPPKEKDFADSEIVRARLETCVKCPHYRPDHSYDAGQARRLTILSVARMNDFSACATHHWSVGLAALIQEPAAHCAVAGCWANPQA